MTEYVSLKKTCNVVLVSVCDWSLVCSVTVSFVEMGEIYLCDVVVEMSIEKHEVHLKGDRYVLFAMRQRAWLAL